MGDHPRISLPGIRLPKRECGKSEVYQVTRGKKGRKVVLGSAIITEKKGRVFIIRMNLPATMNALEKDFDNWSQKNALRQFRDDSESLVAVLTGQGKALSGGSLLEMKKGMNVYVRHGIYEGR